MGFCLVCLSFQAWGFRVIESADKFIAENEFFKVCFDKKHNFVLNGFFVCDGENFIKSLQVVADVENGKPKSCIESYGRNRGVTIKRTSDRVALSVHWQNEYFDVSKEITIFKSEPIVSIHYDFYIVNRPALRVLASPIIDFTDRVRRIGYCDRSGKIHRLKVSEFSKQPFGKFSCKKPGIWYSAGNKESGLVIVIPKLISEYGNFAWPVEFGRGRQLVRNYDVGRAGMFFPHKLAFGSPDTKFSATVVLSGYCDGRVKAAVKRIGRVMEIEKPVFKRARRNVSARYYGCLGVADVWVDWQSGLHRRREKLDRARRLGERVFTICGAKNQYLSFQIIVNPRNRTKLEDARIGNCPFESEIRLCRYIRLDEPSRIFPERSTDDYPSYWPDPLVAFRPVMIEQGYNQGIWITVYIPTGAKSGVYNANALLKIGEKSVSVNFAIRVFDFSLPTPRTFKNVTDVYGEMIRQGRGQSPRKFVDAYSSKIEKLYADLFARYNLSVVSYYERAFELDVLGEYWRKSSAVGLPGGEAMIIFEGKYWPKYSGGKKYEGGDDEYFRAAVETFKKRIGYYRRAGVRGKIYAIITDDALYRKEYRKFLERFVPLVRGLDDELVLVGCVKSNFDNWQADLFDVVITGFDVSADVEKAIAEALKSGKISARWAVLNRWTAIDSEPVELRSIFWRLFDKGITGSWHWDGLWFWFLTDDVYNHPKMNNWWGEGYLVYPPGDNPVPSMRLAQIRAGIDDYEYLTILKKLSAKKILLRFRNLSDISAIELEKSRVKIAETIEHLKRGKSNEAK